MRALILAGGKGTRLRPFTSTIPKPLLPLGDYPIIEIVLYQLARQGFTRATLLLNHMAPLFMAILGDGSKFGLAVDYLVEEKVLGTAGALSLVTDLPKTFLVINGDLLTTLNFRELLKYHGNHNAAATIAANKRMHDVDYGVLEISGDKDLQMYKEKPSLEYSVSMGVNALSKDEIRKHIVKDEYLDMPELMSRLVSRGKVVKVYETDCYWQDIGRPDDYEKATNDFISAPEQFVGSEFGR